MLLAIAGVVGVVYLWIGADAAVDLQERLPGADKKPAGVGGADEPIKIAGR